MWPKHNLYHAMCDRIRHSSRSPSTWLSSRMLPKWSVYHQISGCTNLPPLEPEVRHSYKTHFFYCDLQISARMVCFSGGTRMRIDKQCRTNAQMEKTYARNCSNLRECADYARLTNRCVFWQKPQTKAAMRRLRLGCADLPSLSFQRAM